MALGKIFGQILKQHNIGSGHIDSIFSDADNMPSMLWLIKRVVYCVNYYYGCIDFAGKIIGIIGRQKQIAKCWHNRSKFEQNIFN